MLIGPYNSAHAYSSSFLASFSGHCSPEGVPEPSGRTLTSEGGLRSGDEKELLALAWPILADVIAQSVATALLAA